MRHRHGHGRIRTAIARDRELVLLLRLRGRGCRANFWMGLGIYLLSFNAKFPKEPNICNRECKNVYLFGVFLSFCI